MPDEGEDSGRTTADVDGKAVVSAWRGLPRGGEEEERVAGLRSAEGK
jgi:hypothetical protein